MDQIPANIAQRLLFLLHRGFAEARNLALASGNEQISDLADAFEILPRYVQSCNEEDMKMIRFVLKNYQEKYPDRSFDYLAFLDKYSPPERY